MVILIKGDGFDCEDIDECLDPVVRATLACDVNADCTNLPGSFECGCNVGFNGTGLPGEHKDFNKHSSLTKCGRLSIILIFTEFEDFFDNSKIKLKIIKFQFLS